MADLYKTHWKFLSANITSIIFEIFSSISSHAHDLNSRPTLHHKLDNACSILEISGPPLVHFENESFKNYLTCLRDLLVNGPSLSEQKNVEAELVSVCKRVLQIYLECGRFEYSPDKPKVHCILPLGTAKKEELAARTPLVLLVMRIMGSLERDSFRRHASQLFPLLVDLVRSEHSSVEVQQLLSNIFKSCLGPIVCN